MLVRVALVGMQERLAQAITRLFDRAGDLQVVGTVSDCETLAKELPAYDPDLVLMSVLPNDKICPEHIARIREHSPSIGIILLTWPALSVREAAVPVGADAILDAESWSHDWVDHLRRVYQEKQRWAA